MNQVFKWMRGLGIGLAFAITASCSFDPYGSRTPQRITLPSKTRAQLLIQSRLQSQERGLRFTQLQRVSSLVSDDEILEAELELLSSLDSEGFCWGIAVLPSGMSSADACDSRGVYSSLVSFATESVDVLVPVGGGWTLAVYAVADPTGKCSMRTQGLPEWRSALDPALQYRLAYLYQYQAEYELDGGESAGLRTLNSADEDALAYAVLRLGTQTLDVFSDTEVTLNLEVGVQELESPVCVASLQDSAEVLAIAVEEEDLDDPLSLGPVVSIQENLPIPSPVPSFIPQVHCAPVQLQDAQGHRSLAWSSQTESHYRIYSSDWDDGTETWATPQALYEVALQVGVTETFGCLKGSMNLSGDAFLIWSYEATGFDYLKSLARINGSWASAPQLVMGNPALAGQNIPNGAAHYPDAGQYGVLLNSNGQGVFVALSRDFQSAGGIYVRSVQIDGGGGVTWGGTIDLVPASLVQGSSVFEFFTSFSFEGNPTVGAGIVVGSIYRNSRQSGYEIPIVPGVDPTLPAMGLNEFGTSVASCEVAELYAAPGLSMSDTGVVYLAFSQERASYLPGCAGVSSWNTDRGAYTERILLRSAVISSLTGANANTPSPFSPGDQSELIRYTTPLAVPTGVPAAFPRVDTAIAADGGTNLMVGWSEYDSMPAAGGFTAVPRVAITRKLSGESSFAEPQTLAADDAIMMFRPEVQIDSQGDGTVVVVDQRWVVGSGYLTRLYGARWLSAGEGPGYFLNDAGGLATLDEGYAEMGVSGNGSDIGMSFSIDALGRGLMAWIQKGPGGHYSLNSRQYR